MNIPLSRFWRSLMRSGVGCYTLLDQKCGLSSLCATVEDSRPDWEVLMSVIDGAVTVRDSRSSTHVQHPRGADK